MKSKMVKIAALAAVLVMGCTAFYGCGEEGDAPTTSQQQQEEVTLTGTWKFGTEQLKDVVKEQFKAQTGSEVDENSTEFQQAMTMLEATLGNITYELKDDGTVTQKAEIGGQSVDASGTYTVDGNQVTITMEGTAMNFTFDAKAGTLSIEQQGMTLSFVKA